MPSDDHLTKLSGLSGKKAIDNTTGRLLRLRDELKETRRGNGSQVSSPCASLGACWEWCWYDDIEAALPSHSVGPRLTWRLPGTQKRPLGSDFSVLGLSGWQRVRILRRREKISIRVQYGSVLPHGKPRGSYLSVPRAKCCECGAMKIR